jgi:hypothetical protein
MIPDRIGKLIEQIEAGETITQGQVDRIARLQALDIAHAGRTFLEDQLRREAEQIEFLRKVAES